MQEIQQQPESDKLWQKTPYANLVRYVPRGTYYARLRVGGKLIRKSLKTPVLSVAKLKLADLEKEERGKLEGRTRLVEGKAMMSDLVAAYLERLDHNPTIKPRTRQYWRERLDALRKSWPEFDKLDARKINEDDCRRWAGAFMQKAAPSNFNNTVALLKNILTLAVEQGIRYANPAKALKRQKVRPKQLLLPSQAQFRDLVAELRRIPFGHCLAAADLVEFLAYGGFRKSEAANITWADCDFKARKLTVRGDPETGTKNGEVRHVPMIPDMQVLLARLREARGEGDTAKAVMRVRECNGALKRACKAIGIPRITHHDLRHLFATRCIESSVDIPTVSRWLGHKDGGALAMKVYGHLRDEHSADMAQRVTFEAMPALGKAA